ncbi:hypothetical protein SERLA73DRAFT_176339 [Serpula lacrymans var. lacrymans S7.3]|uniref:Peptidase S28 n=2 Tax=Serpula lacrymans var. lacrymans TaxID=341189 RepID=F8PMQ9_SERL3|nr:uncharacterized protein SERLADRAFT_459173 [Serpula lacrymans var. lacrymans S7.9]EGO02891.1 hypothetical protein SERLA73DRAFT_176339 [Serpula lacrymans var. lacrymans S7.3]EGO28583.1 hypothetical protein SERLADRAFT_459173 [Serpula lacrymans var. lacrymans S7.9]
MASSWLFKSLLASSAMSSVSLASIPDVTFRGRASIPKISASKGPVYDRNGTLLPALDTVYYFNQLIDHNNPGLGTFQQRYWTTWQFYKSGGPIVLMTPGEANAEDYTGYLTTGAINGLIAQQENGATVLLEHRFFGFSNPRDNLASESLELLTIQQAIDDLAYFAENVDFLIPGGDQVKPHQAPWVLIGGSYSGALTSWTMVNKPGVFWAGYSSSGVVEAITDFYDYFTPIRKYMPAGCAADVEAVIAYLDESDAHGNATALNDLKSAFGLTGLSHIDDFASALRTNLFDWQKYQPSKEIQHGALFSQFCDALENVTGVVAGPSGRGLDHAIIAWGAFWKNTYYKSICGQENADDCLGSHDPTFGYYSDTSVNNADRSWLWIVCNQVGFYQVGPPEGQPAIVSRILQPTYAERECVNYFPQAFSAPRPPTTQETNAKYGGWNLTVDRLFSANGLLDPWRGATMSADGVNKPTNVDLQPVYESNGFHCSDLVTEYGSIDPTIAKVQAAGLSYMKTWLSEWKA